MIENWKQQYVKPENENVMELIGYRPPDFLVSIANISSFLYEQTNDAKYAEITKDIIGTPRWHFYPAQEALAKCGARSIPYMVRTLETSDDEEVRKLSAGVITMIMGQALGTPVEAKTHARLIVEAAMRKQPDQVKKARLKAALSYFKLSRLTQPTDNK